MNDASGAVPPLAVGVLALQGDVAEHRAAFAALGVEAREVRRPDDLEGLDRLVIPGGESTTLAHLLDLFALRQPIVDRHRRGQLALFGTCAGAILLGRDDGEPPSRLGLLDIGVERNAYGRQRDSFVAPIRIPVLDAEQHGVFIRAPAMSDPGPGVEVLARLDGAPVLVRAPGLLAATFHPELAAGDSAVHRLFLSSAFDHE